MSLRKKIGRELPKPLSIGEEALAQQLKIYGIYFVREFKFHPERKWRFDFALDIRHGNIGIEVEGGTYGKSRHTTAKGYGQDCEKYDEAAVLGWKVLRFTTDQVKSGYAIDCIRRAMA